MNTETRRPGDHTEKTARGTGPRSGPLTPATPALVPRPGFFSVRSPFLRGSVFFCDLRTLRGVAS